MAANIEKREPTQKDIEDLASNLRQADKDELKAAGFVDPLFAVMCSVSASHHAIAVIADGELAAICGVVTHCLETNTGIFWCLGTDVIGRRKKDFVRVAGEILEQFLSLYSTLWNAVDVRNNLALRWLSYVGCEIGEPYPYGGTHFVEAILRRHDEQSTA